MNNFYNELFLIACRETLVSPEDVPNRDAIILNSINKLSDKQKDFIIMLKPPYLENDPDGKYSMSYVRHVRDVFRMSKNELYKYKREIKHNIINNMKEILFKMS